MYRIERSRVVSRLSAQCQQREILSNEIEREDLDHLSSSVGLKYRVRHTVHAVLTRSENIEERHLSCSFI